LSCIQSRTWLFIGDDPFCLELLRGQLALIAQEVVFVQSVAQGLSLLQEFPFLGVFYACKDADLTASPLLTRGPLSCSLCCLLLTPPLSLPPYIDHLLKPLTPQVLQAYIQQVLARQDISTPFLVQGKYPIIANAPTMQELLRQVPSIAKSQANVFITGESGTGKEVLASMIHHYSPRIHSPFIKVNCAAIPEALWESEFFGHEKGAFTGAVQRREGRFELAHMGTLLLDEISEVPLTLQAKLLRSIQEREFERVGGTKSLRVDVRIISTSNRNMQETLEKKLFREDLYFRLHVIPLHIPSLRERTEDILPLAHLFLQQLCKQNAREDKSLSEGAQEALLSYAWPGNVRELMNVLERAVVLHEGAILQKEDLFSSPPHRTPSLQVSSHTHLSSLADFEKEHILATLRTLGNNRTKAAKSLDISVKTLRNKLKSYESFS